MNFRSNKEIQIKRQVQEWTFAEYYLRNVDQCRFYHWIKLKQYDDRTPFLLDWPGLQIIVSTHEW